MDESSAFLDYRLFVVDGRCCTWRDALGFFELSGDLAAFVDQLYDGVVAEDFVSDIDRLPGPAQVQDASHESRYAANLITADETAAWLATHSLSLYPSY